MESLAILILYSHPWKFGGGETYVLSLIEALVKGGHQIILVTDDTVNADLALPGVLHYPLKFRSKNPLDFIRTYSELKNILQKHEIDIIHAQQRTSGYFAAMLKKQTGVPFVITMHDIWHRAPFKKLHGRIFNKVIAVSEYMRQHFIEKFSAQPANIITIHNGVDEGRFIDQAVLRKRALDIRTQFNIKPDEQVVALVGRVTKAKGHFDLIAAIEKIQENPVKFKVLIVGDGPDYNALEQLVGEKRLTDKVIFAGYQSDIPGMMTAADIVVLPSYREALGLSIIEALLAKRPVIASKVGGIPEIITDEVSGLLVEPGNVEQLADGLIRLLSDGRLCEKLGQAGYERAIAKFTLTKMVDDTVAYYKKAIIDIM